MSERARSAELAALTTIAAQVNCTQDLDEILAAALRTTLEVVGVDAGEVYLVDLGTGGLTLSAQQGLSPAFGDSEAVLGAGECLCGLAVQSQQVVIASEIESHPARSRPACLREGFHSLLCLPLRARGQVLGLLNVQSREPHRFGPADQELLTAIGNQIGIALANARLIDDAEQRRATLDGVMNSLVDGLILVDGRGRIEFANPCAGQMLGLAPQALTGQSVVEIDAQLAGRLAGVQPTPLQAAAAGTSPAGVEFSLLTPSRRTVQARPFPIRGPHGEPRGLGLLLRDITREKELDELKSRLLATVSHELRTPLASIKGFATTLLRQDVQWDEDSRREFLAIIDQESDRLSELIGNLLDMSRIEAGTLRVVPEMIDVGPIIQETTASFQALTHRHRLRTRLWPGLASPPLVWADARRVRQVLRNLVDNAVKYSPEGGDITLEAELVGDTARLSVSDQGLGIAPEHLDYIFDRFYQVDNASTRRVGGAGLGLSICKAIVEAHGGQIWVDSGPGTGSTFYFTLPLAPVPATRNSD